jgi:hypothetical protein
MITEVKPGYFKEKRILYPDQLMELDYNRCGEIAVELNQQLGGQKVELCFLPDQKVFDPWDRDWKTFEMPLNIISVTYQSICPASGMGLRFDFDENAHFLKPFGAVIDGLSPEHRSHMVLNIRTKENPEVHTQILIGFSIYQRRTFPASTTALSSEGLAIRNIPKLF